MDNMLIGRGSSCVIVAAVFALALTGCNATGSGRHDAGSRSTGPEASPGDPSAPAGTSPEVQELLEAGGRALDASRYTDAERAFEQALALEPHNTDAKRGLAAAQSYMNDGPMLSDAMLEIRLRREAVLTDFDIALRQADAARREQRFTEARGLVLSALASVERERDYLTMHELESRRERAREEIAAIDYAVELRRLGRND